MGGGGVSKEIGGSVLLAVSRLASVTFKRASKVFIEETDKNFEFIREICILGFGDMMIPIVIENQTSVLFWNERSSGVKNFKDSFLSFSKISEHIILIDRSHFLIGRCTAALSNLDTATGGSSEDILGFKCAYF